MDNTNNASPADLDTLAAAVKAFQSAQSLTGRERREAIKAARRIIAVFMVKAIEALPGEYSTTAEVRAFFKRRGVTVPGGILDRAASTERDLIARVRINSGISVAGTPNAAAENRQDDNLNRSYERLTAL